MLRLPGSHYEKYADAHGLQPEVIFSVQISCTAGQRVLLVWVE
jgi:hypothetical protein